MSTLYLDCFSGISGDMTIGALLDVGGDFTYLEQELNKLHLHDEYALDVKKVVKNGITCKKFDVVLHEDNHTADGHGHHHTHDHHHRSYKDIVNLIESADYTDSVKDMALRMFEVIGQAEGKIHGLHLDDVHFHEVGAIDSIIDIVGTAILIDQLQVDVIKSTAIPTGSGKVHIAHGIYPVPAPATLEVLKGVPLIESDIKAELTTPTGAAIIAVLVNEFSNFPSMKVKHIGYGAGSKTFPNHPNVLRAVIGE